MDFWPTDDQSALQEGVRTFCQGRFPFETLHDLEAAGGRIDRSAWKDIADMGVFSLRNDGFGITDAALVFEELGRALVPGPLVATYLAATHLSDAAAATGASIIGLAEVAEPVTVIEHAEDLDQLLLLDSNGVRRMAPNALPTDIVERPVEPLTPLRLAHAVTAGGDVVLSGAEARALRLEGTLLTAAMQVGVSFAAIDLAVEYAKGREQFGRPIGQFQAVKHMCADMLTRAEVARSAMYAASANLDGKGEDDAEHSVRVAKMLAGDAAIFCGKTGIQVHGGMGFTWEVNAQRFWKRATVLDTHFGNSDIHADAIAAAM
jgi:alkylation response protein AidB-like acyl-CoA dehydrogenase